MANLHKRAFQPVYHRTPAHGAVSSSEPVTTSWLSVKTLLPEAVLKMCCGEPCCSVRWSKHQFLKSSRILLELQLHDRVSATTLGIPDGRRICHGLDLLILVEPSLWFISYLNKPLTTHGNGCVLSLVHYETHSPAAPGCGGILRCDYSNVLYLRKCSAGRHQRSDLRCESQRNGGIQSRSQ